MFAIRLPCPRVKLTPSTISATRSSKGLWIGATKAIAFWLLQRARIDKVSVTSEDERGMTFLGFLIFTDPPKPGLVETLQQLEDLGIRLKLITGDNRLVASAIARKVGFKNTRVMSGAEVEALSQDQLREHTANIDIFAEIEPTQKERIVLSLKNSKHVVGFLGDGINDVRRCMWQTLESACLRQWTSQRKLLRS